TCLACSALRRAEPGDPLEAGQALAVDGVDGDEMAVPRDLDRHGGLTGVDEADGRACGDGPFGETDQGEDARRRADHHALQRVEMLAFHARTMTGRIVRVVSSR